MVRPVFCVSLNFCAEFSFWQKFRGKVALAELGVGNTEKGSYLIGQLLQRYPNYPEMLLAGAAVRERKGVERQENGFLKEAGEGGGGRRGVVPYKLVEGG